MPRCIFCKPRTPPGQFRTRRRIVCTRLTFRENLYRGQIRQRCPKCLHGRKRQAASGCFRPIQRDQRDDHGFAIGRIPHAPRPFARHKRCLDPKTRFRRIAKAGHRAAQFRPLRIARCCGRAFLGADGVKGLCRARAFRRKGVCHAVDQIHRPCARSHRDIRRDPPNAAFA